VIEVGAGWTERTLRATREAGLRSGGARRAVVEFLGRQSCCLTAQEIFDGLRADGRRVGIASVYRVLDRLVEMKLVQRVDVGAGIARYEPVLDGEHHHHLVCNDCGRVEAFTDPALEQVIHRVAAGVEYDVGSHEVLLHGACADCR